MNAVQAKAARPDTTSGRRPAHWMGRVLRQLVASQVALSQAFDRLLPRSFRIDGAKDFKHRVVPNRLRSGIVVYDIGGGARPCVDVVTKRLLEITLVGLDIDEEQFAKAPAGLYDRAIVADIGTYREPHAADLVVCKSTLEHVRDTEAAFATMAQLLKPGGTLLVFAPSRNALYARLNLLLPERLKRRLLSAFMPDQADHLGFPARYDRCTPCDFRRFASCQGLEIEELRPYYITSYFSVVFPLYLLWRAWIIAYRTLAREHAAETFVLIARKPRTPASGASVQELRLSKR